MTYLQMVKNRCGHTCSFTQAKHYFSDQLRMSKIKLKWSMMGAKVKNKKGDSEKLPSCPTVQQNHHTTEAS